MNAALNLVENIIFINSDLFRNIPNIKFDYIVFNSPTDREGNDYKRLLEAGEQILQRFFTHLKYYLRQDGYCQVSMGIYDSNRNAFEKINSWLSIQEKEKLYLVLYEEKKNEFIWRRIHLTLKRVQGVDKIYRFSYNLLPDNFDGKCSGNFVKHLLEEG